MVACIILLIFSTPIYMNHLKRKALKSIARKEFGRDLLFVVPSTVIILFYSQTWMYNLLSDIFEQFIPFYGYVINHSTFFHITFISIAIVLPIINKYYSVFRQVVSHISELDTRILIALNNALNVKVESYRTVLMERKKQYFDDARVFRLVADPDKHVHSLSENLLTLFKDLHRDIDLKLTAVLCENNILSKFVYHSDYEPKIEVTHLKDKDSTAKASLKIKQSIIIEDIDKPNGLPFFNGISDPMSNIKCIYCCPIYKSKEVNFMLCFSSPEKKALKAENKQLYDQIIDQFSNRYLLEWYLYKIKEIYGTNN